MFIQRIMVVCLIMHVSVHAAQKEKRAESVPLFSLTVTHQTGLRAASEPVTKLEKDKNSKVLKAATAVIWGLFEYPDDTLEYAEKQISKDKTFDLLPPNFKPMAHFLDGLEIEQSTSTKVASTSTQAPEFVTYTHTNRHEAVELAPAHSQDAMPDITFDAAKKRAALYKNLHITSRDKSGYSPSSRVLPESVHRSTIEIADASPVNLGPEEETQFMLEL